MKINILILLVLLFVCFTNFSEKQNKYLPVCLFIQDTTFNHPEIILNLKAVLGANKIKTISKEDLKAYINNEILSVGQEYKMKVGNIDDFSKAQKYISANMRKVANSLTIDIRLNHEGIINDTIKWVNQALPTDYSNLPKVKWHYMILDSTNAKTILQMSQSIVDSIIVSNVLVKE